MLLMVDNNSVGYKIRVLPMKSGNETTYQTAEITAWLKNGSTTKEQHINFDLFIVE